MKKLAVLAAIATVASVNAAETKMNLKGRFDYVNKETKETGEKTLTAGEYQASYLRWKTTSKLNDTTSAELTLNFAEAATGVNSDKTLTNFVDTAFLTKSFGNGLSVMVGKQAALVGGRENDWSSADMYGKSIFNQQLPSNLIGLSVGYSVAGQDFYLQHLEGENSTEKTLTVDLDLDGDNDTIGMQQLKDKKVTGVAWYGNLMNDMIKPIASYHKVGTDRAGQYDTIMAIGAQVNWQSLVFELDYLSRTNENAGRNADDTAVADREINSIVAHVRYAHDMYRPFAKYVMETIEGDSATAGSYSEVENTMMELGLEIVPNKDEDFRYHVVYSASTLEDSKKSPGVTAGYKLEETKIFAGIKFGLNL